jgi:hypothetical protein
MSGTAIPVITWYEIPTSSTPQQFSVTLNGVVYNLTLSFRNNPMAGWTLDIADANNINLACGLPLVTGVNLLEQYAYLGINGTLIVSTDGDFFATPTFDNLGTLSHLWFGVRTA